MAVVLSFDVINVLIVGDNYRHLAWLASGPYAVLLYCYSVCSIEFFVFGSVIS